MRIQWVVLCNVGLMVMATSFASGQEKRTQVKSIGGFDRSPGYAHQMRSVTYAQHGMAATSDLRSTQAAVDILREGGSAVDAAIAANCVLGVVEPMSCGIGGDLFSIVWDAKEQKLAGLNASGRSPALASLSEFEKRSLKQIPEHGPLSWSVPGCVAGWHDLHARYGRLPWKRLFQPAIDLAENGFPVASVIAGYWKGSEKNMLATKEARETFLLDGQRAPVEGQIMRNPRLAATLRKIAELGASEFYTGSIADEIDRYSAAQDGGLLRKADLAGHKNDWVDPVSTNYRGYDVWELPPNGQGISVLQILNMLEPYDIKSLAGERQPRRICLSKPKSWPMPIALVSMPICRWPMYRSRS